jgi:hypothetical protein
MKNRYLKRHARFYCPFLEGDPLLCNGSSDPQDSGVDAPELPRRDPIYSLMGKRLVEMTLQEMQRFDGGIEVDEYYFGACKRH